MQRFLLAALPALALTHLAKAAETPKILYVGDSIAWETSDVVAWWSQNYIKADTSRVMWGGLAICDFTIPHEAPKTDSTLRSHIKSYKPDIVVLQFVGNALTPCMQNLGDEKAYFAKYYSETELATKQITDAAKEAGIPRPKVMWVLQGPSLNSDHNERLNDQYREIAAKNGDLVSDAGYEVSAAAFPGADYKSDRAKFTYFVPCSDFEKQSGYCTDPEKNLARVHKDHDPTHYCLGKVEGFGCSEKSPGLLRYGMRIAGDIAKALSPRVSPSSGGVRPSANFDWVGIIGTGQSLSVGAWFAEPLTNEASYNNLKLFDSSGSYQDLGSTLSVAPLSEPLKKLDGYGGYPKNILGPSHHKGMGDVITELSLKYQNRDYVTAHSEVGLSGTPYSGIMKGGSQYSFDAALYETRAFAQIAQKQGKRYGVGAIVLTHGEADWKNLNYKQDMAQMQIDFEREIKAITGQQGTIPLFTSQQQSFPCAINLEDNVDPRHYSMQKQWHVGNDYPGKVYTIGPKYQYPYRDTIHLTAEGYDSFGRKAGEVLYRVMEMGEDWKPLKPNAISRISPRTLRVVFHVPNPPLRWDEAMEAPHQQENLQWKNGRGFEVIRADKSPIGIKSVSIVKDMNAVDIELDEDSKNADRVQYAMTLDGKIVPGSNDWGCYGGSPLGFRGQLMDSDSMIDQPNYLVSFSKSVE